MRRASKTGLALGAAWLALRAYAALRPTAFPYFLRPILELPRPLISRRRVLDVLAPVPGERILEIGPGTGYYTVAVAERLGPDGRLDVLEIRPPYLEHTLARARRRGLANVAGALGDGAALPYPDDAFDAAFLVGVLGEIADPPAALRELRRVVKPSGRVVVAEMFPDPDFPRLRWLLARAREAGLELERRTGIPIGYVAGFRATPRM